MGSGSGIEWTDNTFNPWIGCTKVSAGCANCYAERDMAIRFNRVAWGDNGTRVVTSEANWGKPLKWNAEAKAAGRRVRVFCASLADVLEDWEGPVLNSNGVPLWREYRRGGRPGWWGETQREVTDKMLRMDDVRLRLLSLIQATPSLIWLILTKRPENILKTFGGKLPDGMRGKFENVFLGTSVENQGTVSRLKYLQAAKACGLCAGTFVSAEPLVGSVNLSGYLRGDGLDWVITGGESGPGARPASAEWFTGLRDQCAAYRVPFFFKQWGEFDANEIRVGKKAAGRELEGKVYSELPKGFSI